MSEDETVILLLCSVAGGFSLRQWFGLVGALRRAGRPFVVLAAAPVVGLLGVLLTLLTAASWDVQSNRAYVVFYLVMGAGTTLLLTLASPVLGLHLRDDVLDRGNTAAGWVGAAALVGGLAAFAGGNVGDGPGWWCVVFAAGLALTAWLGAWAALEALAHPTEHTTIDRDPAAALRLAGFLVATGVLAGRGAAGDWVSAARTVVEFADAWPILPLLAVAAAVERSSAPTPARPVGDPLAGAAIGAVYVGVALLVVVALGRPSGL